MSLFSLPKKTMIASTLIISLTILLNGCGDASQSQSSVESEISTNISGTNGNLISIQSDNVQAAGYDANSMVMTVQFQNGYTYEYYNVPAGLWSSFIAAQPNPWSTVGYPQLVQGGFQYRRIR